MQTPHTPDGTRGCTSGLRALTTAQPYGLLFKCQVSHFQGFYSKFIKGKVTQSVLEGKQTDLTHEMTDAEYLQ